MTEIEFLDNINNDKKAEFHTPFERYELEKICFALDDTQRHDLLLSIKLDEDNLCKNGFFSLKQLAFYAKKLIFMQAESFASKTKLKGFKGDRYEEKEKLRQLYLKKHLLQMPEIVIKACK